MFEQISRSLLGTYGQMILDLVLEHQLIFSSIIIISAVAATTLRRRRTKEHPHDERNHQ
jgi:hypothetical protein